MRYNPPVAGDGYSDTARDDRAREESMDRSEFLRFARLLDNDGAGFESSSGVILQIEHGLGRPHRGWFLVGLIWTNVLSQTRQFAESSPDDSWYLEPLADTHIQVYASSGAQSDYNFKIVVF